MDQEILVDEILTSEMIAGGQQVLNAMEKFPLSGAASSVVDAAFWMKESTDDTSQWKLVIASPGMHFEGSRKGYEWIKQALTLVGGFHLPFDSFVITDTNNRYIEVLRNVFDGSSGKDYRFRDRIIDGFYFEDCYIYRIDPVLEISCDILCIEKGIPITRNPDAYVWGKGLVTRNSLTIVAHGKINVNGSTKAIIELPTKYGITSKDNLRCSPFITSETMIGEEKGERRITNLIITRI